MKHKSGPELIDDDNPEWTQADFARARPAIEVLPEIFPPEVVAEMLKPRGRPRVPRPKAHVNLRLDADVLEYFKAQGKGYQTRINTVLREAMQEER
jgi:uncharacterized protein (DUF4415 family)